MVSARLERFMERSGVLPTTQFAYWECLCTCYALWYVSYTLQSVLESGQEARTVQIDFSVAIDMINHQGLLYKLSSVQSYCVVYIVTVSIKPIISLYGGWLSE